MRIADILFFISLGIAPVGIILRINDNAGGSTLFAFGLLGIFIYFIASIIKSFKKKNVDKIDLLLKSLIVVITPIILSKYLYYNFGDYLGLIIIPFFLISTFINLIFKLRGSIKITLTSILICLLIVPLFDIDFNNDPRNFVPRKWYDRYNVDKAHVIELSYYFKFKETESLSNKAFEAKDQKDYFKSIHLFKQAISIEPDNPTLRFGMSESYAYVNELELAKIELDTAIIIDNKNDYFYNNRGLLYYKLSENGNAILDFKKAIELDSTQYLYYCNIALVFNDASEYDEACRMIDKAEELGANIDEYKLLKKIRNKHR
ncbi:hypothetical protein L3049_16720 [Labilibaculum sp. DW002]|uniref:Tetratricopeptide repeat protein n=1 Tax=Paralabilibaculum antarcticum TaxID=2912572 RepID=A0ABT5VXY0_9BACT|nr:hypothetical protein [Labilibaculum sp. DW002]MDE5419637.1 hypothetical protein [Labilibaculum sp. DW002]